MIYVLLGLIFIALVVIVDKLQDIHEWTEPRVMWFPPPPTWIRKVRVGTEWIAVEEGPMKKGGRNKRPSTPRPASPPKGQRP